METNPPPAATSRPRLTVLRWSNALLLFTTNLPAADGETSPTPPPPEWWHVFAWPFAAIAVAGLFVTAWLVQRWRTPDSALARRPSGDLRFSREHITETFISALPTLTRELNLEVATIAYSWSPDKIKQFLDRIWRIDSREDINIYMIVTEGTIDERMADLHEEKCNAMDLVLDGEPLAEDVQELSMADLMDFAAAHYDPAAKTIDEEHLDREWPKLRATLGTVAGGWKLKGSEQKAEVKTAPVLTILPLPEIRPSTHHLAASRTSSYCQAPFCTLHSPFFRLLGFPPPCNTRCADLNKPLRRGPYPADPLRERFADNFELASHPGLLLKDS